ncbi:metallophosphoesterase family protein [Haliangium ochraceum]|uniref:Metallophosphoesterase n=1 Tax=Haliangium ochraceum (strain DSM 14365 / JCM 11303 / SMP-2) TaxID=502025 RepID=D0LZN1_HALO1|nr:metallophosphoesterase [Haliangium ochraceum]ACY18010.1 metallophosphoesterase [Haliangium ochraceum DSM 14365]
MRDPAHAFRPLRPAARRVLTLLAAVVCACAEFAAPSAAPAEPAPAADPGVYIARGSEFRYRAVLAPLPTHQLGAVSAYALDAVARAAAPATAPPSAPPAEPAPAPAVLGQAPADVPPPGWPARALAEDSARARLPVGASAGSRSCQCATAIADSARERVAAVYLTHSFRAGAEAEQVRLLHLRARYRDGLVAYLNGRQIARRNLAAEAGLMDQAERPHGPEWETFYIPLTPGLLRRGDNLLAIELRPSSHQLAPSLDLELSAASEARIIRGPLLQRVGARSASIAFETDLPTEAVLEYGPSEALGQVLRSAGGGLAVRHRIALSDLPPGQPVYYRVIAGSQITPTERFHPAPQPGEVLRFAVYGDVRGGHDIHRRLIEAMEREAPAFVLSTGDLVLRGSDEGDWQRFFDVTGGFLGRVPYYPAAGNHDMGRAGDERRRMNEIFDLWPGPEDRPVWGHWYSFEVADLHIVMLDSNAYEHPEQRQWLERDLAQARARGVRAIFAVVHDGPFSRGLHRGNRFAAAHYVPILTRHGVTLLLSGHDHLYQRGRADGLAYMVSGGGGAPLYSVRCGVGGKPRCEREDGMEFVSSEHHYILVTVYPSHVEACPRRADGTALEACATYSLAPRAQRTRTR